MPSLTIVVGKGGVGRSSLTAALGLACRRPVVLVELVPTPVIPPWFDCVSAGYREIPLVSEVSFLPVTWQDCLQEYARMKLRFAGLVKLVFDNPFVRHLLPAIPGLAEILVMGKIIYLAEEGRNVIVDAPATGHALSLLCAPTVIAKTVKTGPLAQDASRLANFLANPASTQVLVAAKPEEMPVLEALELVEGLRNNACIEVQTALLNSMATIGLRDTSRPAIARMATYYRDDPEFSAVAQAALFLSTRKKAEKTMIRRLEHGGICRVIPLPHVIQEGARQRVETLAEHLEGALWKQ